MEKLGLIAILILTLNGCTSLIENGLRNNLVGTWVASEVEDVATGDVKKTENGDVILFLFQNETCDAISLEENGDFSTFYQNSTSINSTGTWEYEFGNIDLDFENGKSIKQIDFNLSGDILVMPDTILGRAKMVTFEREL